MKSQWPVVELKEVIRLRKEFIEINDIDEHKRCRVQLHAKGIVLRDVVTGAQIKTKQQQVCRAGELLVAEIDAKVGGYGIVPPALDGSIVSSHYFLFKIQSDKLDSRFLGFFLKTPAFRDQVSAQGSTNYAAVRPTQILSYAIPLPPLLEQQRIVAKIENLATKIDEARSLHRQATEEVEALCSAVGTYEFQRRDCRFTIGGICTVIDPNPTHRYPMYVSEGIPIISSSDFVGEDAIDWTRAQRVPEDFYQDTLGRFEVGAGDIIFSRKGKVGYARSHPEKIRLAMTHTLCVLKPDRARIEPRYLLHFARSSVFLSALRGTMNPNVGVPTLGLGVIRDTEIPVPPLSEQKRIMAKLDEFKAKGDALKALHSETASALDALLPAILDRAFKGEL